MDCKVKGMHALSTAALLIAAVSTAPVQAASVTYFMNQSNVSTLPDGTDYLKVTLDDDGVLGDINFTVETLAPLSSLAVNKFGIDQFGFNTDITLISSNITNAPSNWSLLGSGNMDGFGGFSFREDTNGANNRIDPLTFSITGITGDTFADYVGSSSGNAGEGNALFAAHVAGFDDGNGNTSGFFAAPVPVPAAVWLFGSGLLGLAGVARRKKQ